MDEGKCYKLHQLHSNYALQARMAALSHSRLHQDRHEWAAQKQQFAQQYQLLKQQFLDALRKVQALSDETRRLNADNASLAQENQRLRDQVAALQGRLASD